MPRLYLDTNILIDFLGRRAPFHAAATEIFRCIEQQECTAFTSAINLVHTHYQLKKQLDAAVTVQSLELLISLVSVCDVPAALVPAALKSTSLRDFEDAIQFELAKWNQVDFLITRNQKDFPANPHFVICDAATYLRDHHPFIA